MTRPPCLRTAPSFEPVSSGIVSALGRLLPTQSGRVRRAWLGIAGVQVPLAPPVAARIGSPTGLQVAGVSPGSPASDAGLHRHCVPPRTAGRASKALRFRTQTI
jgi:S1-C subfamily serine protease